MSVFTFPLLVLGALFLFRQSGFKRSAADPAIFAAQSSPVLAAEIGLPMQPGWRIRGALTAQGREGNAHLEIPLSGPNGRGKLVEWAQRQNGSWHLCSLKFQAEAGPETTLVDPVTAHCAPE